MKTTTRQTEGPVRDIQSVVIVGLRWNDRHGNTYHSVRIFADGTEVAYLPFQYGYERHYEQTAEKWLIDNGYLPGLIKHANGSTEALWQYTERTGLKIEATASDVKHRKDL